MTPHNPPFPRIANCYGARIHSGSTENDIAQWARYDLLIGGVVMPASRAEAEDLARVLMRLKARNPHIITTQFAASAPYVKKALSPGFPEQGYLLTPEGAMIDGWPGTTMIDLSREDVIEYMATISTHAWNTYGIDVFIDCMGPAFDAWACNIATGVPYRVDTDRDGTPDLPEELNRKWREGKGRLARHMREKMGTKAIFMANQAGRETAPWINGILLEDYIDYTLDADCPSPMAWRDVLECYLWWTTHARRPNVTTLQASSGVVPPFEMWKSATLAEQRRLFDKGRSLLQRMRFGLATALLGDGYWAFDLHTRARGQDWWYPEYDAPLGYPLGPAEVRDDGVWERAFDAPGRVLVNPGDTPVTVELQARHRDVSFGRVDTTFAVLPQDGLILLG